MDLGFHLAMSYRNLKHPTSRKNFAAVVGQNHALILTQCHKLATIVILTTFDVSHLSYSLWGSNRSWVYSVRSTLNQSPYWCPEVITLCGPMGVLSLIWVNSKWFKKILQKSPPQLLESKCDAKKTFPIDLCGRAHLSRNHLVDFKHVENSAAALRGSR